MQISNPNLYPFWFLTTEHPVEDNTDPFSEYDLSEDYCAYNDYGHLEFQLPTFTLNGMLAALHYLFKDSIPINPDFPEAMGFDFLYQDIESPKVPYYLSKIRDISLTTPLKIENIRLILDVGLEKKKKSSIPIFVPTNNIILPVHEIEQAAHNKIEIADLNDHLRPKVVRFESEDICRFTKNLHGFFSFAEKHNIGLILNGSKIPITE